MEASGLLTRSEQWRLDTLCETAATLLRVPISMVNVFKDGMQHSVGKFPAEGERQMPVSESGCQHVLDAEDVVPISNTLLDPVMCVSPLVTVAGIRAYLGVPIFYESTVVGTFCVAEYEVRDWSHWDIEGLKSLGKMAGFAVERHA